MTIPLKFLASLRLCARIPLLLGLFFLLPSCAMNRDALPRWVERPPEDGRYLHAVGIRTGAATLEEARQGAIEQAIAELVRRFGVTSETSYSEVRTELETRVRDEIQSASRPIRIEDAVLREMHVQRGEGGFGAFVLLRYPRARAEKELARLRSAEASIQHMAHRALRRGDAARSAGDAAGAIQAYVEAIESAGTSASGAALRVRAIERLSSLVAALRIEIPLGGPHEPSAASTSQGSARLLAAHAWLDGRPAVRLPLRFEVLSGSAELDLQSASTDSAGMASVRVRRIRSTRGELVVRVMPEVRLSSTDPAVADLRAAIDRVYADHRLQVGRAALPIRVAVIIDGNEEPHRSLLATELTTRLHEAGFRVVADDRWPDGNPQLIRSDLADVVVTGSCNFRPGSQNEGWTISVLADAEVRAIDVASGELIGAYHVVGQPGFGERDDRARAEALRAAAVKLADEITVQLVERSSGGVHRRHSNGTDGSSR